MPVALVYPLAALAETTGCFAIWAWWRGAESFFAADWSAREDTLSWLSSFRHSSL
ncbi:hypothetical protein Salmuc_02511 [Salipiger mucosus DSM 16094]|uniref:Uncharacterized protein n=1 Tax=Salipiger mucosus DSM 16094 TaxID=1123237 RepID=S9QR78_9RHOB|nr:hypothetical protein Salmuc_02511 [Salipiger mucosus DSM 16094]